MKILYDEARLEPAILDLLRSREPALQGITYGDVSLYWTVKRDDRNRLLYVLMRRGFVDSTLAEFSPDELVNLSDEDLHDRAFTEDIERQRAADKQHIEQRISEWIHRLNTLYDMVTSWVPTGEFDVLRQTILQREEELMQRYHIAQKDIPILTFLKKKHRVSFVPSALWIIGADGWVNITVDTTQYCLIDMRSNHAGASNWHLVVDDIKKGTVPFTQSIFQSLLAKHT
jgi:hypothetical protein